MLVTVERLGVRGISLGAICLRIMAGLEMLSISVRLEQRNDQDWL